LGSHGNRARLSVPATVLLVVAGCGNSTGQHGDAGTSSDGDTSTSSDGDTSTSSDGDAGTGPSVSFPLYTRDADIQGAYVMPDGDLVLAGYALGAAPALLGAGGVTQLDLPTKLWMVRFHPDGRVRWQKSIAATTFERFIAAASPDGDVVVVGTTRNSNRAVFDPGLSSELTLGDGFMSAIYIARYDSEGRLRWAKDIGSNGCVIQQMTARILEVATDGSFLFGGEVCDGATFARGETNEQTVSSPNTSTEGVVKSYLARYTASGGLIWLESGPSFAAGTMTLTGPDQLVLATNFSGALVFDADSPTPTTLQSRGQLDIAISRRRIGDGSLIGVVREGDTGYEQVDRIKSIPDGGFVVTGSFRGSTIFGAGTTRETVLTAPGTPPLAATGASEQGGFLAHYAPDGTLASAMMTVHFGEFQRVDGLAVTPQGAVVATGGFRQDVIFGTDATKTVSLSSSPVSVPGLFLARFDVGGVLQWALQPSVASALLPIMVTALPDSSMLWVGEWGDHLQVALPDGSSVTFDRGSPSINGVSAFAIRMVP
jgi:hypothetical protein